MPSQRHTEQRQAILRAVKFAPEPLSMADLQRRLQSLGISRATLFRGLRFYLDRGEIAVVDGPRGVQQYVGHAYHSAVFRCQRCGKERRLKGNTLPAYVDRKMFGHQSIVTSQLIAQGLCGTCANSLHPHRPSSGRRGEKNHV